MYTNYFFFTLVIPSHYSSQPHPFGCLVRVLIRRPGDVDRLGLAFHLFQRVTLPTSLRSCSLACAARPARGGLGSRARTFLSPSVTMITVCRRFAVTCRVILSPQAFVLTPCVKLSALLSVNHRSPSGSTSKASATCPRSPRVPTLGFQTFFAVRIALNWQSPFGLVRETVTSGHFDSSLPIASPPLGSNCRTVGEVPPPLAHFLQGFRSATSHVCEPLVTRRTAQPATLHLMRALSACRLRGYRHILPQLSLPNVGHVPLVNLPSGYVAMQRIGSHLDPRCHAIAA